MSILVKVSRYVDTNFKKTKTLFLLFTYLCVNILILLIDIICHPGLGNVPEVLYYFNILFVLKSPK